MSSHPSFLCAAHSSWVHKDRTNFSLSGSSSGTDEASLHWNKYCIGESVQGRRFGGRVIDANIVIIGDVGPNIRTWEREF